MPHPIMVALAGLRTGDPQHHDAMTLFPLRGLSGTPAASRRDPLTLDEAITEGTLELGEVSGAGSVPTIRARYRGARPVLMFEGETIVGAKQDRVLSATVMMAPGSELELPVCCVEQGRWRYRSDSFSAGAMSTPSLRSTTVRSVSESLVSSQGTVRRGDQTAVWNEVAALARKLGTSSSTGSLHDTYTDGGVARRLADYREAFDAPPADADGVLIFVGGEPAVLELLGSPRLLRRIWRQLIESCAVESLSRVGETAPATSDQAREFLDELRGAEIASYRAVGEGEELRLRSPALAGNALVTDGLHHLSAFRSSPA